MIEGFGGWAVGVGEGASFYLMVNLVHWILLRHSPPTPLELMEGGIPHGLPTVQHTSRPKEANSSGFRWRGRKGFTNPFILPPSPKGLIARGGPRKIDAVHPYISTLPFKPIFLALSLMSQTPPQRPPICAILGPWPKTKLPSPSAPRPCAARLLPRTGLHFLKSPAPSPRPILSRTPTSPKSSISRDFRSWTRRAQRSHIRRGAQCLR